MAPLVPADHIFSSPQKFLVTRNKSSATADSDLQLFELGIDFIMQLA